MSPTFPTKTTLKNKLAKLLGWERMGIIGLQCVTFLQNNALILLKITIMRTVKKKETKEKNWTLPGVKLTQEEFMAGIKKAEEGPFYTPEEFESRFEKWKKEKGYN